MEIICSFVKFYKEFSSKLPINVGRLTEGLKQCLLCSYNSLSNIGDSWVTVTRRLDNIFHCSKQRGDMDCMKNCSKLILLRYTWAVERCI